METFSEKDCIVIRHKCSHTKHKDIPIVENHNFLIPMCCLGNIFAIFAKEKNKRKKKRLHALKV